MARPSLPEPLTVPEAIQAGRSAQRLMNLEAALGRISGDGGLTIGTADGCYSHALSSTETEAVLALLIERERVFLSSLGVETSCLT